MSKARHRKNGMEGEGVEVEFLGEGFPAGTAEEMGELLAGLLTPPTQRPTTQKSQPIEQIKDVVVQSAYAIVEDEMHEDEAEFAKQAEEMKDQPQPDTNQHDARVYAAWSGLVTAMQNAQGAGFYMVIKVEVLAPVLDRK